MRRFFRKAPQVSVAMASYNHARFVGSAVKSILDQTLTDLELVVVDDGSTDGTPDIIAGFRDPRIKLIRLHKNRAKQARNEALKWCTGKFVAFQNSDDVWGPEKLERQVDVLERDRELSACLTSVEIIDADGNPNRATWAEGIFQNHGRSGAVWLRRFFDHGNCLCFPSGLVRNNDLHKVGPLRETLVQLPDYDLWIRLAAIGDFLVLDEPFTKYRVVGYENQGAPTETATRRTEIEYVEVRLRYVEPALLAQFSRIFPELAADAPNDILKQAALARYASRREGSPFRFLADRIWQRLFDQPKSREVIVGHFGSKMFHEFLINRSRLRLGS